MKHQNCWFSIVLGFLLLQPHGTLAWGKVGHEMVANVAWHRLSNETRTWVSSVLGAVNDVAEAGSPLAAVASWADRVRYTKAYHWSTPLHYVDVQDDVIEGGCPVRDPGELTNCRFEYSRDCVNDFCAAGAIANYSARLDDNNSLLLAPLPLHANESLKFLIHIVGDIHQPLHSSRKTDKGGNTIHVNFDLAPPHHGIFINRDGMAAHAHGWNLHSVWDDGIIEKALQKLYRGERVLFERDLYSKILEFANSGQLDLWLACGDGRKIACTSVWAQESLGTALAFAYRDEHGLPIRNSTTLTEEYYLSRLQVVQRRIVAAGVRLAWTLELLCEKHADRIRKRTNLRSVSVGSL